MDKYAVLKVALDRVERSSHPDVISSFSCQAPAIRALLAERDALRAALRWNAGALQACCSEGIRESSNITIVAETKCFAEILDMADAALAQGKA